MIYIINKQHMNSFFEYFNSTNDTITNQYLEQLSDTVNNELRRLLGNNKN